MTIDGRSAANTVAEALAELGLPLVGLDYSIPAASSPLPADGQVRVIRVNEQVLLEQRPLPFDTVYQPLDGLEIDQRQLVQPGSYGVIAEQVRVRTEDGVELGRAVEGQWIAQQPVDEILGYGTQILIRSVATADGQLEYWRAVQMYATSYSPSRAGIPADHPWFGITASGKPLVRGLVAIDRSLIPFGTLMYVPGYGFAEAADTGGGVRGRWIDLGYDDDNYVPWHQYVTVYFLTPVPPPGAIVYLFP
jgi:3D (Asp-Asp-Asp) domain-containing protein